MNTTDSFLSLLQEKIVKKIPDEVRHKAKLSLLDYIGVTLAGSVINQDKITRFLDCLSDESKSTNIVGYKKKKSVLTASFVNGINAHTLELDDGERVGMMHPGAPIISAVLSVAQAEKIDSEHMLHGIILGYEAALRIAGAIQPSHKEQGFHATGTCGTIGAAYGVATALGYNAIQTKNTLSSAVTAASGLLQVLEDGSELKPYHVGKAAQSAVISAYMARAGFSGPEDILGGKQGFFSTYNSVIYSNDILLRDDNRFKIEFTYTKPYASCRHAHPAIDATLILRNQHNIDYLNVKSVLVRTYYWAIGGHDHKQVQGVASAKMSIPYSVAAAIVTGKAGMSEFLPSKVSDPAILNLTKLVNVVEDNELTACVPQKRGAIVEIQLFDGNIFLTRVDIPKGEPENPLLEVDYYHKFEELATFGGLSEEEASDVKLCVLNIENRLDDLFMLL